jgi:hypothetical protein
MQLSLSNASHSRHMQVQQMPAHLKGDVAGLRGARTRSQGGRLPPQQQKLVRRGNAAGLRRCIFRPPISAYADTSLGEEGGSCGW